MDKINNIACIMNNEPRDLVSNFKHCGKKLVSSSFKYEYQGITLFWKGHLYNRSLNQKSSIIDPFCIILYYLKNGIYKTMRKINGDFSFVLFDPRITEEESVLYVAMDIFGMFPIYTYSIRDEIHITDKVINNRFLPSCYSKYFLSHKVHSLWTLQEYNTPYYIPPIPIPLMEETPATDIYINNILLNNVQRRIEANGITKVSAVIVMILEEQDIPMFQTIIESIKICGFTPVLCSEEDTLLHEENDYSHIFVFSVAQQFYENTFHEKHVVLYPCVDVFYLQVEITYGNKAGICPACPWSPNTPSLGVPRFI